MIQVTDRISIAPDELREKFVRSPGPGGQHVNTAATAVELRFDAAGSGNIPDSIRRRLLRLAGNRATSSGEIVIQAHRFRERERNREDARERLFQLIRRAAKRPRPRRRTQPSAAARRRRLENKRQRGMRKQQRRTPGTDQQ